MAIQRPIARRNLARRPNKRMHTLAATQAAGMRVGLTARWHVDRSKLTALLLCLVAAFALYEFFDSDLFYVYGVGVNGASLLTSDQVAHASGVRGYSVFFVDAGTVEKALDKLPEVRSSHVGVSLPNSVSISLVERAPAITWLAGSDAYWVDDEGIAFSTHGSRPELTTLRDVDQAPVKPGQPVSPAAVDAYHALMSAWPAAPHTLEWTAERGLAYADEHGWKVYLGDAAGMGGKLTTLQALVPQLVAKGAKIKFVDLSKGDPFYQ